MSRLLLIAVFFEIGLVLAFVPWVDYWDQNYFVEMVPWLRQIVEDPFVRGAVTGLGILNLYAAFSELGALLSARAADEPPSVTSIPSVPEE